MGRAVAKGPQLVRREETGAGVVGLVPQRPIQLARVPTRFVHGERKMFRVQDQVVLARLHRWRFDLFNRLRGNAWRFGQKIGVGDQLVACAQMGGIEAARGKTPVVDRRGLKVTMHRQQIEINP